MKVGIIGGGQLAAMLAQAGKKIGVEVLCLSPQADACAQQHAEVIHAAYDNVEAQDRLLAFADVITYEQEELPLDALQRYEQAGLLKPSLQVIRTYQDRLLEKEYLRSHGLRTAPFENLEKQADLAEVAAKATFPGILKVRRGGYDGKGQVVVKTAEELPAAWQALGQLPCILEGMVSFQRELSIIAARNPEGQIVCYPVAENRHRDGILRVSLVQANDPLQSQAEAYIERLLTDMDYVGTMSLELFDENGSLVANEVAPRVHNSGHWSIEGAAASQFENHLRAITGMPLVAAEGFKRAIMLNLIGELPAGPSLADAANNTFEHVYGKTAQPGRKLGHITLTERQSQQCEHFESRAQALVAAIGEPALPSAYFGASEEE